MLSIYLIFLKEVSDMLKKLSPRSRKILAISFCVIVLGCIFCVSAFATAVSEPDFDDAAQTVYDTLHTTINFNNILAIIGVALGGSVTIFLLWWAIRKIVRMVKGALNGKLKV